MLLSAHTDVVPAEGQPWTRDPFTLGEEGGRFYGRGTTDMKGFIACVLAVAEGLGPREGQPPVMLALSWDEELGCRGIPQMIDHVIPTLGRPDLCIVGEPTSMRVATGHKGKASYRAICRGEAGHSAMAPHFTNALHLATDLVQAIRQEQDRLFQEGARDSAYDPPVSTVHAGILRGGTALNIVPDHAEVTFEIRHLQAETPAALLANVTSGLDGGVRVVPVASYPGLATDPEDPALAAVTAALDRVELTKVAFGTEAGFFAALGIPTLVIGPGTMDDGHQPDESIAVDEISRCLGFLSRLLG